MSLLFTNDCPVSMLSLADLIQSKNKGHIQLPVYQRDAIWSEGRICTLWDSILRGFPLPPILIIRGNGISRKLQTSRDSARGYAVDVNDIGDVFNIIDGQQRMIAIDSVYSFNNLSTKRIWIDIATSTRDYPHPLNNKYWIHSCTKVFPFGFSSTLSGEFDFSPLSDGLLEKIWFATNDHFNKDEFYEYPLEETFPWSARLPLPLDELVKIKSEDVESIKNNILSKAAKVQKIISEFRHEEVEPNKKLIDDLSLTLYRLNKYKICLQLVEINEDGEEYTLFERIGRGGIQITQRQLAVSRLLIELGKEGTDALARFSESTELRGMLETEDIIHGLARIAFSITKHTDQEINEPEEKSDLFDLTPQRIKTIQKNFEQWDEFKHILQNLCDLNNHKNKSIIQSAFENMYKSICFCSENINGFSKAQLAQPDKNADDDGIAPSSLHPLLYWHINNLDTEPSLTHKNDMIRWILFANGFIKTQSNQKLNKIALESAIKNNRISFVDIYTNIYSRDDGKLVSELGLTKDFPQLIIENGTTEIHSTLKGTDGIINPADATALFVSNMLLRNWVKDEVNWFILLWNQREFISNIYNDITYTPALYCKGRPFDCDHLIARNLFMWRTELKDQFIRETLCDYIKSSTELSIDVSDIKLTADNLRKNLPYSIANYRYWPRRLNRFDHDKFMCDKMTTNSVLTALENYKLRSKFSSITDDDLFDFSAIEISRKDFWNRIPAKDGSRATWDSESISAFFCEIVKRHEYLYKNAYDFIKGND